jgi:hypothetical protein
LGGTLTLEVKYRKDLLPVTNKRTITSEEGHSSVGHLIDFSVWRSRLVGRTIEEVLIDKKADSGCILILDDDSFFSFGFSGDEGEVVGGNIEVVE